MSIINVRLMCACMVISLVYVQDVIGWYFTYTPTPTSVLASKPKDYYATLLLVPTGDAHNHGRAIEHQFESSCCFSFVQELKELLERDLPMLRVIISHGATAVLQPYQIATTANTVDADLVISIGSYYEHGPHDILYLYQFCYGDEFNHSLPDLNWYPIQSAYLFSQKTADAYIKNFYKILSSAQYQPLFLVSTPYKIPFKKLVGVKVPALGLEMGLRSDQHYTQYVGPCAAACVEVIKPLIDNRANRGVLP